MASRRQVSRRDPVGNFILQDRQKVFLPRCKGTELIHGVHPGRKQPAKMIIINPLPLQQKPEVRRPQGQCIHSRSPWRRVCRPSWSRCRTSWRSRSHCTPTHPRTALPLESQPRETSDDLKYSLPSAVPTCRRKNWLPNHPPLCSAGKSQKARTRPSFSPTRISNSIPRVRKTNS